MWILAVGRAFCVWILAVREWREKLDEAGGLVEHERTRAVDHETESGKNGTVDTEQTTIHETLDTMVYLVEGVLRKGLVPLMWKHCIKAASRNLPIREEHLKFAWIAYRWNNLVWVAGHKTLNFGSVASVMGWHVFAEALAWILRKAARSAAAG